MGMQPRKQQQPCAAPPSCMPHDLPAAEWPSSRASLVRQSDILLTFCWPVVSFRASEAVFTSLVGKLMKPATLSHNVTPGVASARSPVQPPGADQMNLCIRTTLIEQVQDGARPSLAT